MRKILALLPLLSLAACATGDTKPLITGLPPVQVAAGGKKKKKMGSPNRPPVKKNEAKQAAPTMP